MIKFFRKIRQNMIKENRASKYLLYAIGEIVLVVIGILIALSINNWNVAKKQRQKEIVILLELKKGLESDLTNEFIPGITFYDQAKEALNNLGGFYNNTETISNNSLTKYFRTYLNGEWNFVFNTAAFENLKSTGIDIISNDSLRSKISSLYSYEYPDLKERGNRNMKFFEEQVSPVLSNHVNLFGSILSKNDLYNLKNNIQITNRLRELNRYRSLLLLEVIKLRPEVELLINDIKKELERIDY